MPRTVVYGIAAVFNVLLFWLLMTPPPALGWSGLGFVGAPIAVSITNVVTSVVLLLWVAPRLVPREAWPRWSLRTACSGWGELLELSLPGTLMLVAEWWGGEVRTVNDGTEATDMKDGERDGGRTGRGTEGQRLSLIHI